MDFMYLLNFLVIVCLLISLTVIIFLIKSSDIDLNVDCVSTLGANKNKTCKLFNNLTIFYGLLCLYIPYGFMQITDRTILNDIAIIFLIITAFLTFLFGFFPMDTKKDP